ncbi:MAG: RidA/YER057c/UK114 superfamily protein, partial [uncultured Gemmatimonadaceae bacterium]
ARSHDPHGQRPGRHRPVLAGRHRQRVPLHGGSDRARSAVGQRGRRRRRGPDRTRPRQPRRDHRGRGRVVGAGRQDHRLPRGDGRLPEGQRGLRARVRRRASGALDGAGRRPPARRARRDRRRRRARL